MSQCAKTIGCLLIVLCLFAPISQSQQPSVSQLMLLHVRVTDPTDKAVLDVPQSSFQVTEDGIPQKISLFINSEVPLSYGLVIDCSGSLHSQFKDVMQAAGRVVMSNKPNDETFLIRFISSNKVNVEQETTSDKQLLLHALAGYYIEGGASAVVDAVYLSAQKAAQMKTSGEVRRHILILITDGDDRVSYYSQKDLFQLLPAIDVQIFTIALTKELQSNVREKAVKFLTRLSAETGGKTYLVASPADIDRVANEVINDIRMQYVIGYESSGGDPKKDFHKVQVTIGDNAGQEKRVAITRVGYRVRKNTDPNRKGE
jgi:VWFA-related protein